MPRSRPTTEQGVATVVPNGIADGNGAGKSISCLRRCWRAVWGSKQPPAEQDGSSKQSASHNPPSIKHVRSSASRTDSRCSTHVIDDGHHGTALHSVLLQMREDQSSLECRVPLSRDNSDTHQDKALAPQPSVEQALHHPSPLLHLGLVHDATKKHNDVCVAPTTHLRRMSTPRSVPKRQWRILRRWLGLSRRICVVNK